mgnify:CR=1 FL=1
MYKKKIYKTWFLVPALFIYCVFFILPVVVGIGYSFTNWNSMSSEIKFVGLRNYIEIFNPKNSYLLAMRVVRIMECLSKIPLYLLSLRQQEKL